MQPGDLCLVVGAFMVRENIGKTVRLHALVGAGERYLAPNGQVMENGDDSPSWIATGDLVGRFEFWGSIETQQVGFAAFDPKHLMPIPRGPVESVPHSEDLPCSA